MHIEELWITITTSHKPASVDQLFPMVAFDPGKTTGVVWTTNHYWADNGDLRIYVKANQLPWPESVGAFRDRIEMANTIIVEDFKLYPFKAKSLGWQELHAPLGLGWIVGTAKELDKHRLMLQMAAHAKSISNTDLNNYWQMEGDFNRRLGTHAKDALRHLTHFLVRKLSTSSPIFMPPRHG